MLDTRTNADVGRPDAPSSVNDALARVTGLLRKHRLVEGLVREQVGDPAAEAATQLADSAVRAPQAAN